MSTGQHPRKKTKGLIAAVVSDPGPRFGDYVQSLIGVLNLMRGEVSLSWCQGVDVTGNCNAAVEALMINDLDWLWLIGDDHVFAPDILRRMLEHDADVLVPNCLKRTPGFEPVLYGGSNGDHHSVVEIPASGLFEVYASGQAGMLIKRSVLEAIGKPWFETFGKQNEDLIFSRKIREAGFTIYCDPEILLGHMTLACVWPYYHEKAGWTVQLDLGGRDTGGIEEWSIALGRLGNSLVAL